MLSVKRETPSVVTLDLGLPPYPSEVKEGFAALSEMLSHDGFAKVIVITGQGEKDNALKAAGEGAYDFFCKPIQIDELKVVLQRAFYVSQLERENRELQLRSNGEPFAAMLGTSPQMQEVFVSIRKVAVTDAPVLITGESGTGKELVAKAIHQLIPISNQDDINLVGWVRRVLAVTHQYSVCYASLTHPTKISF